jgi:hypothetical protein
MGPMSFQIQITGPNIWSASTKSDLPYNFCIIKILPSLTVEAVDALQTLFWAPNPWFRVKARSRRPRPDQGDYWEGVLHLLFNKICLKMIDHCSRSTWGPGPSRSGLWAQKIWSAPTKTDLPYNFCFIKIIPSLTVAAVDALETCLGPPDPEGPPWGQNIAYDLALVKLGHHTKFGEDWSNSVYFYTGHTNTHRITFIYKREMSLP